MPQPYFIMTMRVRRVSRAAISRPRPAAAKTPHFTTAAVELVVWLVVAVGVLVCCGCSGKWNFALDGAPLAPRPPERTSYRVPPSEPEAALETPRAPVRGISYSSPPPGALTPAADIEPAAPEAAVQDTAGPRQVEYVFGTMFDSSNAAAMGPMLAPPGSAPMASPRPVAAGDDGPAPYLCCDQSSASSCFEDERSCSPPPFAGRLRSWFQEMGCRVRCDYRNYYTWQNTYDLLYGVAGGSILANTALDEDFQSWYQREVRSQDTDDFASAWKTFGEGQIFIPAFAGLGLIGGMFEQQPLLGTTGEFGQRVTRGYLVGAPPMLLMQYALGGSRPGETSFESRWQPFQDSNSVSGHSFIGAVPFITAAKMSDNPWLKSTLYICSTFPAWSRVNDDAHYLSQIWLGWWMAYLASRSVDVTESGDECFAVSPIATAEMTGLGLIVRR